MERCISMRRMLVFLLMVTILLCSFSACSSADEEKTADEIAVEKARDAFCDQKYGILLSILSPSTVHGSEIDIDVNDLQSVSVFLPIEETDDGIVIDFNELE